MSDDKPVLIVIAGVRVVDLPSPPVPSRAVRCFICDEPTWVSEATEQDMDDLGPSVTACLRCVMDQEAKGQEMVWTAPGPRTIDAAINHYRKDKRIH